MRAPYPQFESAHPLIEKRAKPQPRLVAETRHDMVRLYEALGKPDDARSAGPVLR